MTQAQLSEAAGLSLATIQNIEADRANPSISTLDGVLDVLGLRLSLEMADADWNLLAACGAPIVATAPALIEPCEELLIAELHRALRRRIRDPRRRMALQAVLLALRDHYPSVFGRHLRRCARVHRLLASRALTGSLIKLKRQALARMAAYL